MGQLVEVNAHSLFSKWFSESGKLVSRLFAKINELVRFCTASAIYGMHVLAGSRCFSESGNLVSRRFAKASKLVVCCAASTQMAKDACAGWVIYHSKKVVVNQRAPVSLPCKARSGESMGAWQQVRPCVDQLRSRHVQVEEEDTLVCVLIDEVESLTAARRAAVAGSEPADAVRAVNALLTQLDALKRRPNVLVRRWLGLHNHAWGLC